MVLNRLIQHQKLNIEDAIWKIMSQSNIKHFQSTVITATASNNKSGDLLELIHSVVRSTVFVLCFQI